MQTYRSSHDSPFRQLKHSECQLDVHGMFTEIRISGIVEWPFSGHSVPLNAAECQAHFSDLSVFFFFVFSKTFYQIRGFKVILLLWIIAHEIKRNRNIISFPRTGSNQGILFLVLARQVCYLYATLRDFDYGLKLKTIHKCFLPL